MAARSDLGPLLDLDPDWAGSDPGSMKRAAGLSQCVRGDVTEPIRLHVLVKRYFCTVDPACRELLLPALVQGFKLQGSLLSAEEILFEQNPFHHDAIRLGRSDDRAKIQGHVRCQSDTVRPAPSAEPGIIYNSTNARFVGRE